MMYLGIDYGEKRIGLAISDRNNSVAKAYGVIPHNIKTPQLLSEIIVKEKVDGIVVGLPLGIDEKPTQASLRIEEYFQNIGDILQVPIYYINEEMSTVYANASLRAMHIIRKRKKTHIDQEAARIILQMYLDRS